MYCKFARIKYRVSQNYVNTNGLFFSCRYTYAMGDRLTLQQRRVVASLMEAYGSPTIVRQKFAERFAGRDPPSRLTIYRVYAKFVETGSVADNYRGNAGRPRTGRSDLNIAVVQQAISQSPSKSTTRCSLETGIPQKTVWQNTDCGIIYSPRNVCPGFKWYCCSLVIVC